jgi:nitrogenase molybdenum-iron protein NifN
MPECHAPSPSTATVNPCKMCMPMGAVFVFRGIEGCMPLFHGSQGCSTYMRLYLAHHFREPVDIASSALSEKGAVYGGAANLKKGLKNVIAGYAPLAVGIATTCLAETIGDDVPQIIREFRQEPQVDDVMIFNVSTPSYKASHEAGYSAALKAVVQSLAERSKPSGKINLLLGSIVSPADVRYIKRLLCDWGIGYILLPDISESFDAPLTQEFPRISAGGTPLEEIRDVGNSEATISIGAWAEGHGAGDYLREEFDVPHFALPLPLSLETTDSLVGKLEELSGQVLPDEYEKERGRLLDTMVDAHKLMAGVKTCVYGDTEMVLGLAALMRELGMSPQILATGSASPNFDRLARELAPGSKVMSGADFSQIQEEAAAREVELLVGPFTGRQTARAKGMPLLRVGFPNHDRFGAARQLVLGYEGAGRLVDAMANALLEDRERRSS